MRRDVTDQQFDDIIFGAQRSAWRWEQQPRYWIGAEQSSLTAFLDGRPQSPLTIPALAGYYGRVRDLVRNRQVRLGRVRVVDNPPTDYQRWLAWMDQYNRDAGEQIHYLSRGVLQQMGRPPFAPDDDWWLIDDEQLLIISHHADGSGRVARRQLLVAEPEVRLARLWRLAVTSWALEEEAGTSAPAAA